MKSIFHLLIIICCLKLAVASFPLILSPKTIYLDTEEKISVTSMDQRNEEHYDFEIRDSSVQSELFFKSTFKLHPNETIVLKFTLTKYPTFGKVAVSFTDHSTKKSKYNLVPVSQVNGITIVQTDKPIYTPKQEIKLRILRLDKDLRPINDNIRLKIVNPQNIIMENILFNKENQSSYFVDHQFYIPPGPIMGIWKAVVYQTPEHSFNTTFEVQEYVLPTFKIELNTTELILKSTKRLEGKVSVSYVYGKPVEGFVTFKFGYGEPDAEISFIGKSKSKELLLGMSEFSFETKEFYVVSPGNLLGKRFVVEVEVNEFETGKKFKKQFVKGLFSDVAFKFSFEKSIKNFKPGFENTFVARLYYADGRLATNVPVNADIPEISLVKRLATNKDGYLNLSFIVDNTLDQVTINLKTSDEDFEYTEQLSESRTISKHESPTGGYLTIAKSRRDYRVGDQFETDFIVNNIDHNQFVSFNYYLISPSGNLIDAKRVKYFESIKFRFKNEHYPQVTLVVIAYSMRSQMKNRTELKTNDIILTDTLQINIDLIDNCGIETNLFVNDNRQEDFDLSKVSIFKPGEKVSIEFKSATNQQLSLIGVDEAVYSLSANTLLVKDRLKKIYRDNTLVCGEGGHNYDDVLLNSGLILFDPDVATNHNPISSMCNGYALAMDSKKKANKNKQLRGSNRIKKRDIDIYKGKQVDYNYLKDKNLKQCCLLGAKMTENFSVDNDMCVQKLNIFKKYVNDTACVQAFTNCCFINQVQLDQSRYKANVNGIKFSGMVEKASMNVQFDKNEFVHIAEDDRLEKSAYVREDFQETWLFDVYPLERNRATNLTFKLPDSITTQSLSTFALSKEAGICFLQDQPIRFLTFKDVFVQVLLPYQAVQNEQLEMIITVFNYNSTDQPVIVYFYGVEGICSEAETGDKSERKSLAVPKNSSKSVTIPLVPLTTGKFKIKIVAVSTYYTDVVIKELDVIPQGVAVEDEYSFQLDPKNKQKRAKRHITTDRFQDKIIPEQQSQFTKLKLSPNQKSKLIVPNSEQCIISAIADEFGPAMAYTFPDNELATNEINRGPRVAGSSPGLDRLIRRPRGCGEQTAFYYAPTLYTMIYLQSINKLNLDLKEKGVSYLKSGYKRQLMFRKTDGSFAAFPNRRSSIWLTSFIMKLFCVSSKYIELDNQVIKTGLKYLFQKQDPNGYWNEVNPVVHKQLIGGASGRVSLTASVLSSLRVCSRIEQINLDVNQELVNSIQRAENFLNFYKEDILQTKNAFKIALIANSLIDSLSYREHAIELLNYLNSLATVDEDQNKVSWNDDFPIETASLVLLSLANIENQKLRFSPKLFANSSLTRNGSLVLAKSTNNQFGRLMDDKKFIDKSDKLLKKLNPQSIVNYLNSQKTFTGGFDSTQDTILALNALADHYRNQISSEQLSMNLNCEISTLKSRVRRNLQFNNENALVMKRLQLDVHQLDELIDEELSFTTKGNGLGFMSVKLKYNVILPEKLCKFELNVELREWRFVDQSRKQARQGSNRVVEDKNKNPSNPDSEDEFDEMDDEEKVNESEFENMFGQDLLDELANDTDPYKRTRRNVDMRENKKYVKRQFGRKVKRESNDEKANEVNLDQRFKDAFKKLKAKDDEQEELVLKKLEDHFEQEEDQGKFKYEIESKARTKRSIFDYAKFVNKRKNDVARKTPTLRQKKVKSNSISDENIRIISMETLSPRSDLDDGSFPVYKLKICAQHIPNYDSEMTIIEIGLLTGFEIDKEDLQSKVYNPKVNHSMTQLSKVVFEGRTILMYLDSVAHGRLDCYTLKMYQTSQVANLQSGVVRIFDYYRKDDSCTTLYSPAVIEHLNITCENKACTCSVNNNCPDNKQIHDLIKISDYEYSLGKEKFRELVCYDKKLGHVFTGRVVDQKLLQNNLLFKIEALIKYRERGPKLTNTVVLVFNQECSGNLDIKVDESYIFFLNGTNYLATGENHEDILTIYPTRKSMIYSMTRQANSPNNVERYLDEINKQIAKGHLICNES